jgi:hypothetical protein
MGTFKELLFQKSGALDGKVHAFLRNYCLKKSGRETQRLNPPNLINIYTALVVKSLQPYPTA